MKYWKIVLIMLLLCGCRTQEEEPIEIRDDPWEAFFQSLPDQPGEGDGIFVVANDGLHFTEVWDEFVDRAEAGEQSEVTIARHTIEGDIIYEFLLYDGEQFNLYTDDSRDRYGTHRGYGKEHAEYLYDLSYVTQEETGNDVKPFLNRYGFLSDVDLEDEEAVKAYLEDHFENGQNDVILIWGTQYLLD